MSISVRWKLFSTMLLGSLAILAPSAFSAEKATKVGVFVGTYTGSGSEGIYRFAFDTASGEMSAPELVGKTSNPSFLALHPSKPFLYAVSEVDSFEGKPGGAVAAYQIVGEKGKLSHLNSQSTKGSGPCHVIVDKEGKNIIVANYGGGSVAVLPILPEGKLSPASAFVQHKGTGGDPSRQGGPHAHSSTLDPANAYAFVADLGLDKILVYKFDPAAGTITPNKPAFARTAPASGPRHFDFHPTGKYAYAIDELDSTVTSWNYDDEHGNLLPLQTISTLPKGVTKTNYPADIPVHPSGKFLYGSNRGHDSIAVYTIAPLTGKLTFVEAEHQGIKNPRNFAIDPTGEFLLVANQDADNIVVFKIDLENGSLEPTGASIKVAKPVCLKFQKAAE